MANQLSFGMAKEDAYVYAIDIKFPKKVPSNLKKYLKYIKCDITNAKKFQNTCDSIYKIHKRIDVLINGAGVTFPENEKKFYSVKKWKKTFRHH